jgi:predicted transcriptional regulator
MIVNDIYNVHVDPIHEDMTVREAVAILLKAHHNGVLVYDDKKELAGIFCIQDVVAAVVPEEMRENINLAEAMYKPGFFEERCAHIRNKRVKQLMRTEFFRITRETNIMALAAEFLNTDLFMFPVMEKEDSKKVVGVITRSEVKKALALGMDITP